MQAWAVLAARTGTPPAILQRLDQSVVKVVETPSVRTRIDEMGVQARSSSLEDARKMQGEEVARRRRIVEIARAAAGPTQSRRNRHRRAGQRRRGATC